MTKFMNNHDYLQIDQAANGCISGTLKEWPHLKMALERLNIVISNDTKAIELTRICRIIIEDGK